jgi:hypothetical protein
MSTVLRVTGPFHELATAIAGIGLAFSEAVASKRVRERKSLSHDGRSTFNLTVCDADGDQVPQQIEECERFLNEHADELAKIKKLDCAEKICLDFMWFFPKETLGQFTSFPCSLLTRCVELGIDLEISVYATSDEEQAI